MGQNYRQNGFVFLAAILAWFVAGLIVSPPVAAQRGRVPVTVGGSAEFDACPTQVAVKGLNRRGDNFLAVRAGPGSTYSTVDKIRTGRVLNLCGRKGAWIGVVYGRRGQDCGVGSAIARRRAYRGRCRSGWVHRSFVREFAG